MNLRTLTAIIAVSLAADHATGQAVTSLYVSGDPGEWVTQGETVFYSEADFDLPKCRLYCEDRAYPNDYLVDRLTLFLQFRVDRLDPDRLSRPRADEWVLQLGTDKIPARLVEGVYTNAQRASFATLGHPGIDISADGLGNDQCGGNFTIHHIDIDYSSGMPILLSLAVSFSQYDDTQHWLHGTFFYNYQGTQPSPSITGFDVTSQNAKLSLSNLLPGSTITVERATDLAGPWNAQTSFVGRTMSLDFTNAPPSDLANRTFYRVKAH
jgi:hypothetical protein